MYLIEMYWYLLRDLLVSVKNIEDPYKPCNRIIGLPIVLFPFLLYGIRSKPNMYWSFVSIAYVSNGYPFATI